VDVRSKQGKTPLDLAEGQEKVKKLILAYCNNKGSVLDDEEFTRRKEMSQIVSQNEDNKKTENK
jgi:hypothetical protein